MARNPAALSILRIGPYSSLPMLTRATLLSTAIVLIAGLTLFSLGPHMARRGIPHRLEHVIAFAVLALLLLPLGQNRPQKWFVVSAIFCVACALEIRQHQVFNQAFEWWDVRDDSLGVVLALLLVHKRQRTSNP